MQRHCSCLVDARLGHDERLKWEWASEALGPKWERLAASSALTFVMMSDILIFFDLSVNALPRRQHA